MTCFDWPSAAMTVMRLRTAAGSGAWPPAGRTPTARPAIRPAMSDGDLGRIGLSPGADRTVRRPDLGPDAASAGDEPDPGVAPLAPDRRAVPAVGVLVHELVAPVPSRLDPSGRLIVEEPRV